MLVDTVDGLLVTATVPVVDKFGWTKFVAMAPKPISLIVYTRVGAVTTAHTITMSLSPVSQVLLQTVYSSNY